MYSLALEMLFRARCMLAVTRKACSGAHYNSCPSGSTSPPTETRSLVKNSLISHAVNAMIELAL